MIGNILEEFKLMLKEVDWMDDISKSKALAKVNNASNYCNLNLFLIINCFKRRMQSIQKLVTLSSSRTILS